MNYENLKNTVKRLREQYPSGSRIILLRMGDDPRPVEPFTRATVRFVDDIGTLHCDFDNGRHLGVCIGEDSFRALTKEELEEEKEQNQNKKLGEMELG